METAATSPRTYTLQSHGDEFLTGLLPDDTQALLVPLSDEEWACLLFDAAGKLISSGARRVTPRDCGTGETLIAAAELRAAMSLRPAPIVVRVFDAPVYAVGIRERPGSFEAFLADPAGEEPDARYRASTHQHIREWDETGRFVFMTWGKEYWIDPDGSVYAT